MPTQPNLLAGVLAILLCCPTTAATQGATRPAPEIPRIEIATPAPPPEWALVQRHLLDQLAPAALEFVRRYTRPDGTVIWRDVWPGMDGSDDGYESFYNFPLYYALGGASEIEGHEALIYREISGIEPPRVGSYGFPDSLRKCQPEPGGRTIPKTARSTKKTGGENQGSIHPRLLLPDITSALCVLCDLCGETAFVILYGEVI